MLKLIIASLACLASFPAIAPGAASSAGSSDNGDTLRNRSLDGNDELVPSPPRDDAASERGGCCSEVAALHTKLEALEKRLSVLEASSLSFERGGSTTGLSPPVSSSKTTVRGIPDYYKLKDKAPERLWLDVRSWFYISFEIYAGDVYLGEFRQSMPWIRLIWDEICFYDASGSFHGQLYFGLVKRFLGAVPNPFIGDRDVYLRFADGSVPLTGAMESLLRSMFSAERRSLDFVWEPTSVRFKSRKTIEVKGQQEWVVEEASGQGKASQIQESVIHDMWGRRFRGWTVSMLPDKMKILDPIVPGYFAAYDLAEAEDNLPLYLGTALSLLFGTFLFYFISASPIVFR